MRNDIDTTRVLLNMQVDVNSTNVSERFVPLQGRSNLVDAARPPLSAVVFEARIKEYFLLEEAYTSSFFNAFSVNFTDERSHPVVVRRWRRRRE